jgi:hypothetical protein
MSVYLRKLIFQRNRDTSEWVFFTDFPVILRKTGKVQSNFSSLIAGVDPKKMNQKN